MASPAMPNPARVVSRSVAHLERAGYARPQARKIIRDVIAAVGADRDDFEPWALNWLRSVWLAAAEPKTPAQENPGGPAQAQPAQP